MKLNSTLLTTVLTAAFLALFAGASGAQCILANPSFELGGSGSEVFGGWSQFGVVGSSTDAIHGSKAARVTGPSLGGWDVSGYWQPMDTSPGDQWEVTAWVQNPPSNPLTGQCSAIINIEWRDSSGELISYESYTAATPATPQGEYFEFSVVSGPAPSGTVQARVLLGVLQSPTDPAPSVLYDQVTFYSLESPTMDEQQWADFPGGRTVDFAGRSWRVKGPGYYGPGPNLFCDNSGCVWVDERGLHLTIKNYSGWYCSEVALEEALGYGDYIFTTRGRLDTLDPSAVFGLFLWQYGPCYDYGYLWWNPYNEIDVEFSFWGDPSSDIGQFVAQPYDYGGNISRFDASFSDDELTSHAFRWLNDRIEFRSWRGWPDDEGTGAYIHTWTYTGPHIPRPEQPRVHLNLWLFDGAPASEQEVVIDDFTFIPGAPATGVTPPQEPPEEVSGARLFAARPNPFNPRTTIGYRLQTGAHTELDIYDISGRLVRTLVSGFVPAGEHQVVWDGRDSSGRRAASGVYLYRLSAGGQTETRRMVLVK